MIDINKKITGKIIKECLDDIECYFDSLVKTHGYYIIRQSYFYTHGKTAEDLRLKADEGLTKVFGKNSLFTITDFGEHWAPFSGGASLAESSHWFVKFIIN